MTDSPPARPDTAVDATAGVEPTQQCGRCRKVFEMEPTNEPGTLPETWFCASCRVELLGRPTSMVKR
jgi:hypothetical protein